MSHQRHELREYANQQVMDDLNELFISIKVHLFNIPVNKGKPTIEEMDDVFNRTIRALKADSKPMRR